jgi:hypothetical protein
MAAKTGDKQKAPQVKHMGVCSHEVKPVKFYGKGTMKYWCDKCNGYAERVKR